MNVNLNPKVDRFFVDGCMRCKLGGTPQCKVHQWQVELESLRQLLLECQLTEELKWGMPCYTVNDKNVVMISAFKEYASINFMKGVLLKDPHKILTKQGENSRTARLVKFTNPEQFLEKRDILKTYILEAMEIEKSGKKVEVEKNVEPVPEELTRKFDELPAFKKAFYALTPGRQRGYIIYFSQPKKSETRTSRIDKYQEQIFQGIGLNDKYSGK